MIAFYFIGEYMAKNYRGGKRSGASSDYIKKIKGVSDNEKYSQSFLQSIESGAYDLNDEYERAKLYTTQTANKDNFYMNSIGIWNARKKSPKREPDHISYNSRTGEASSKYWYTKDGVYRESDHWGAGVASCNWALSSEKGTFNSTFLRKFTDNKTGFIKWEDLKANGEVQRTVEGKGRWKKVVYKTVKFEFKK